MIELFFQISGSPTNPRIDPRGGKLRLMVGPTGRPSFHSASLSVNQPKDRRMERQNQPTSIVGRN